MKCADLSDYHASNGEDHQTGNEAKVSFRDLRDGLPVTEDQDGDGKEELDCLEEVDAVAGPAAVDSEECIGVGFHGVFVGIEVHVYFPELESGALGVIARLIEMQGLLTTWQDHQRQCREQHLGRNPFEQMPICNCSVDIPQPGAANIRSTEWT